MAGYSYPDWINAVTVLLQYDEYVVDPTSASPTSLNSFNLAYPRAIEYAEQRCYREIDFVGTLVTDASGAFTANQRVAALPDSQGQFVVIEQIKPIVWGVPQQPMLPVSRELLDALYPSNVPIGTPSIPQYWTLYNNTQIIVGPAPDQAYNFEAYGTQRPAPLSATNATTFLTQFLPDLFLVATMIWWGGYQRTFSPESQDAAQSLTWEQQYKTLAQGALVEEFRKKYSSAGASSRLPSPIMTPPQT
jgi:hypothetical protein